MKKVFLQFLLIQCLLVMGAVMSVCAQQVKNVILMIPDGCSLATISTARWYQWMTDPEKENLAIDPYICGTVRTTCSNAPIGDSAPTTSCYMTGYTSLKGWVSTYPTADPENDIYPVDSKRAYQPLTTVLEASKMLGKSTGLVCTCYFPHATPADCSAHCYNRDKYDEIASQQAHNRINVVIGGGVSRMTVEGEAYLKNAGWDIIKDDLNAMRNCQNNNMWALFCPNDMPYELDRDANRYPSLAEMTSTAIKKLSNNQKGFFLMVEGSKVDYAAHNNDLAGMIHDYLAFDEACRVAIEFAKTNGETAVLVLSDHGNSGLSIGRRDNGNYAATPKNRLFGAMKNFKATAEEVGNKLNNAPFEQVQSIFKEWCGFELNDQELEFLKNCDEYKSSPIEKEQRRQQSNKYYRTGLTRTVAQFMTDRTGMAFTTNGHTGEDVILAGFHPDPQWRPVGEWSNVKFNGYLCSLIGITRATLDELTNQFFAPHKEVLDGVAGVTYKMEKVRLEAPAPRAGNNGGGGFPGGGFPGGGFPGGGFGGGFPGGGFARPVIPEVMQLTITTKTGNIVLKSTSNVAEVNVKKGKMTNTQMVDLKTVVVYVDKNETFYIPRNILSLVQQQQ
ncbi:MAG: alkaline phosphatase [Bacteroidaceae bacterium]|nr:alkaline phosphatase [Bacteroidaceae bacterium]